MRPPLSKSLGCIVALAALSATSSVAFSQPSKTAMSGEEAARLADAHFLQGKALLKSGDLKGAYREYRASWDLKRTYDIAANLGNVEIQLGLTRDAAEHFAFSLRNAAVSVAPDRLEKIRKLLDQAKAQVGAVTVKVNVDGAEVLVDGEVVGRSPIAEEIYVDPGRRSIEAKLAGHESAKQSITVERAGSLSVSLTLKQIEGSPYVAPTATEPPPPPPHKPMIPIFVGAGVTAVGLGVGIVSALVSSAKSNQADDLRADLLTKNQGSKSTCYAPTRPADCMRLDAAYVDAGSFRNLEIIGFAAAGVAAVATLTYALIPPSATKPTDSRVRASVIVGPGSGGMVVQGRF